MRCSSDNDDGALLCKTRIGKRRTAVCDFRYFTFSCFFLLFPLPSPLSMVASFANTIPFRYVSPATLIFEISNLPSDTPIFSHRRGKTAIRADSHLRFVSGIREFLSGTLLILFLFGLFTISFRHFTLTGKTWTCCWSKRWFQLRKTCKTQSIDVLGNSIFN